jgi:hypothetical protein
MGNKGILALKLVAWVNLIFGCIGSLIIFSEWGRVLVSSPTYDFITHYETNPIAIAIAIALLLEGIFGFVFLSVICSMALNLIAIRENSEKKEVDFVR